MLDGLTLDQMRVLIAVAEAESFSAAARRLGCVQSAVSQSLQTLEQTMRLSLFDRSGKMPVLTDVGREVLHDARQVVQRADALRSHAETIAGGTEPELAFAVDSLLPTVILMYLTHPGGYPARPSQPIKRQASTVPASGALRISPRGWNTCSVVSAGAICLAHSARPHRTGTAQAAGDQPERRTDHAHSRGSAEGHASWAGKSVANRRPEAPSERLEALRRCCKKRPRESCCGPRDRTASLFGRAVIERDGESSSRFSPVRQLRCGHSPRQRSRSSKCDALACSSPQRSTSRDFRRGSGRSYRNSRYWAGHRL
jgi:Bacterial regulatory helix-turn-helix protein, lysR family